MRPSSAITGSSGSSCVIGQINSFAISSIALLYFLASAAVGGPRQCPAGLKLSPPPRIHWQTHRTRTNDFAGRALSRSRAAPCAAHKCQRGGTPARSWASRRLGAREGVRAVLALALHSQFPPAAAIRRPCAKTASTRCEADAGERGGQNASRDARPSPPGQIRDLRAVAAGAGAPAARGTGGRAGRGRRSAPRSRRADRR